MTPADDSVQALRAEHEALTQFLYLAPVGLVQASLDGEIGMMNPISVQLLMPLSRDGGLTNLFTALEGVAPGLRLRCRDYPRRNGMVCEGLRIQVGPPSAHAGAARQPPRILSLTILKLDEARLMAVMSDVSAEVRRERQLRRNDAWLNAILARISDYALVALDRAGRLCEWNESIPRVTGFGRDVLGAPCSIFRPAGAMSDEQLGARLRQADRDGWSQDEGWCQRADGSRFWGSALIAPLPDGAVPGERLDDHPAYCLILRDCGDRPDAGAARHGPATDHSSHEDTPQRSPHAG